MFFQIYGDKRFTIIFKKGVASETPATDTGLCQTHLSQERNNFIYICEQLMKYISKLYQLHILQQRITLSRVFLNSVLVLRIKCKILPPALAHTTLSRAPDAISLPHLPNNLGIGWCLLINNMPRSWLQLWMFMPWDFHSQSWGLVRICCALYLDNQDRGNKFWQQFSFP